MRSSSQLPSSALAISFRSLALDVSQVRKSLGVTFTCKNGLDDTYAGFSRNVRQDKRKFYVHLLHGFLHTQDYA